jgi:tRNA (guanine37-N1)-methyltransferase
MIMRVDIIDRAVQDIVKEAKDAGLRGSKVVLMDAGGEKYTQRKAQQLAESEHVVIICGHYEGVDHRVHEHIATDVVSIGEYVLSGGEIPAMVVVDSITRLIPGVLGNAESLAEESFVGNATKEYPQYTRPEDYKGWKVPEVLRSGDHKEIKKWRESNT